MTNDYVIQLETARRLYEAGVTKDYNSMLHWYVEDEKSSVIGLSGGHRMNRNEIETPESVASYCDENFITHLPALSLQELMEVMPKEVIENGKTYKYESWFADCIHDDEYVYQYSHIFDDLENRNVLAASNHKNPLRALEALALYLLDNDLWPNTKEV